MRPGAATVGRCRDSVRYRTDARMALRHHQLLASSNDRQVVLMLHRLTWSSLPSAFLSAAHLGEISAPSRRNNERNHISGRLLFTGAHFLGVLEGDERDLGKLWLSMAGDERHRDVIRIGDALCGKRWFPEWMMAYTHHADIGAQIEAIRLPHPPSAPPPPEMIHSIMLGADSM
jgi:hypothetical protein